MDWEFSSDRVSGKEASALLALKEDQASRRTYPNRLVHISRTGETKSESDSGILIISTNRQPFS